jgi:aerobic-type carbon monoxide dehydrogenase small subunit (CoxS/CutS family)
MDGVSMSDRRTVRIVVNGNAREALAPTRMTLADFLRDELDLTGTHVGCEHGVCGACTVLLDGDSVRSCLVLAVQAQGHTVETIEGLADGDELHPAQRAFSEEHGLQCGFCTPGLLMATAELLDEDDNDLSRDEIRERIGGNLCRCTGYQNIVNSVEAALSYKREATAR